MARKRQRKKDRAREEGPHGDGMGEQGDLLAEESEVELDSPAGKVDEPDVEEPDLDEPDAGEADPEGPDAGDAAAEEPPLEEAPLEEPDLAGPREAPEEAEPDGGREDETAAEEPGSSEPDGTREGRQRARRLVEAGRVREAIEVYRRLVAENPRDLKARNNLGVLYDELGQHELALEQLDAAAEIDPEHVEVMTNRGAALTALGRFAEAEEELRRAQKIYPEDVDVRTQLGVLLFRRGLYGQAEVELRWVCSRAEDHGAAHYYRGEALNRLGKVDAAIEALERAIVLQPENARAYYTLGILFDRKHMPEEAARMYRKSRELQQ